MTRNPASARTGTWLRHSRPESGNPGIRMTGRPSPVTSYSMPTSPASTLMDLLLTGHDGQQLGAARRRDRLVAPSGPQGDDLVEQARPGHHVSCPAQHHGDADEAAQAVGVLEGGIGKGLADLPAGIAGAVLATTDESIDLRETGTVRRRRGAVPGLDNLGCGAVEGTGELPRIVQTRPGDRVAPTHS